MPNKKEEQISLTEYSMLEKNHPPLNFHAIDTFSLRYILTILPAFVLISLNYAHIDERLCFSYVPFISMAIFSYVTLHLLKIEYFRDRAVYLVDICAFFVLSGATLSTLTAELLNKIVLTAPLEISLICALPMGYHSQKATTLRNLSFVTVITLTILLTSLIADKNVFTRAIAQQIFVGAAGGIFFSRLFVKKLLSEALLNELLSAEREVFYRELNTKYFPHQIQMISQGFTINQTLPVGTAQAFCLKFDIVKSTKVKHDQKEQIYEQIFEEIEKYLSSDLEIIAENPIRIRGRGFLAASAGDAVFLCFAYPFEGDYGTKPILLLAEIEKILTIFESAFHRNFSEKISVSVSAVYEPIRCAFVTKRRSYSISGPGIFLAERYENLRKKFPYVEGLLQKGKHALVMQNKVYNMLEDALSGREVEMYCFGRDLEEKHVRDDPTGDCFYVTQIDLTRKSNLTKLSA